MGGLLKSLKNWAMWIFLVLVLLALVIPFAVVFLALLLALAVIFLALFVVFKFGKGWA